MAQKVRIILEDDLDGGPADETIRFGLDGAHYEIDLSSANAARLRDAIRPFVAKSRRVQGSAQRTRAPAVPPLRSSVTPRPQRFASGLRLTATRFPTVAASTRTFRMHTTQQ